MDKLSYLFAALSAKAYMQKEWIIGILSVILDGMPKTNGQYTDKHHEDYPYRLFQHIEDDALYFLNPLMDGFTKIEGSSKTIQLFNVFDEFDAPAGTIDNQPEAIFTCVGNIICNAVVLCYPFGNKIPYINDRFTPDIDNIVSAKLAENKEDQRPEVIQVDGLLRYHEALGLIEGLTQITIPSITQKAVLPNKELWALRERLMEENKDKLDDPTVMAMIKGELEKADRQYLADDDAAGFYTKGKFYSVTRMKMHGTYGHEPGFGEIGDEIPVIKKSISEGLDLDNLPALFDNIRSASNSRGVLTALGGAASKYISRIFQNSTIAMDDCGTKEGFPLLIHPIYMKEMEYLYSFDDKGNTFMLTLDWLKSNQGKMITVRTPQRCIAEKPSYCAKCLDKNKAIRKDGIYLIPMEMSGVMQNNDMKAMHGRRMSAVEIDLDLAIL